MSSFLKKKGTRPAAAIDVAPMMDMVFILLIFFVVTSTFTRETGVDISKPQASSAKELSRESVMVGISKQGTVHINESQVSLNGLRTLLKQIVAETPDRSVIIIADRDAPSGRIVDVLDECNLAKVKKVSVSAGQDQGQ